jgi:hypothetical protein
MLSTMALSLAPRVCATTVQSSLYYISNDSYLVSAEAAISHIISFAILPADHHYPNLTTPHNVYCLSQTTKLSQGGYRLR